MVHGSMAHAQLSPTVSPSVACLRLLLNLVRATEVAVTQQTIIRHGPIHCRRLDSEYPCFNSSVLSDSSTTLIEEFQVFLAVWLS